MISLGLFLVFCSLRVLIYHRISFYIKVLLTIYLEKESLFQLNLISFYVVVRIIPLLEVGTCVN